MVILKKLFHLSLFPLLLISSAPSRADWTENHFLVGALAIGGTVAAGIGINAMLSWFDETNESMINQTRNLCAIADKEYAPYVTYLIAQDVIFNTHARSSWHSVEEKQLYHLADLHKTYEPRGTFKKFIARLHDNNSSMISMYNKIEKRLAKIKSSSNIDYKTQHELIDLLECKDKIAQMLPLYQQLYSLLDNYRAYFSLFDVEAEIRKTYENELTILSYNHYDQTQLTAHLKASIAAHGTSSKYPLTKFIDVLDNHLECLNDYLQKARGFPNRYSWCLDLKNQLSFIKGIIISDHAYSTEVIAQERERIEREKLMIAQQQLALQQKQLSALKEQNRLEKEKCKLEEERLKMERRQVQNSTHCKPSVSSEVSFTITL
ncbi:hypothetical protein Noda2021_10910 [Candidatus Dependentiae bacterium Noda2021]|nr:hypothetical protein Noda2021_10910 [Candidatus Dependentiae bacterium Noda2021]